MLRFLCTFVILFSFSGVLYSQSFHVFVPSNIRANTVQQLISKKCPDLNVLVFGRSTDFYKSIENFSPYAVLSLQPVVTITETFSVVAKGIKNGEDQEPYLLVSIDKSIDLSQLLGKRIGVVDLLGRKKMQHYISSSLGSNVKVKRVIKEEDLLPLLAFNAVDAIYISTDFFEILKEKSNLKLMAIKAGVGEMLPVAGVKNDSYKGEIISCIQSFDANINVILGINQWRFL